VDLDEPVTGNRMIAAVLAAVVFAIDLAAPVA